MIINRARSLILLSNPEYSLEELTLKLKLQCFGHMIGKDTDAGKDWGQEEKGVTEDEMLGWHHRLNGHEVEQTAGDGERQGSLECCSPWSHKSQTWLSNWTITQLQSLGSDLISCDLSAAKWCLPIWPGLHKGRFCLQSLMSSNILYWNVYCLSFLSITVTMFFTDSKSLYCL